ncbi:MAG: hypothetical protein F9K30_00220 [Dechloromonas sp.]|nr:MAG: hypothetical protein F9K30_00220 [Dechloromonas sp.]
MKYRALSRIDFNHQTYNTGDVIELSSAEAAPLLEVRVIEPFSKAFSKAAASQIDQEQQHV